MRNSITKITLVATVTATIVLASAAVATAGERPQTWDLKSLLSHARQDYGATQDTHWFYADHPNPSDPCGVSHTESGEQLITIHPPKTNVNLTFHPNGTVTPSTFTVPATPRRNATRSRTTARSNPVDAWESARAPVATAAAAGGRRYVCEVRCVLHPGRLQPADLRPTPRLSPVQSRDPQAT